LLRARLQATSKANAHTASAVGGGAAVASATAGDIEGQFDPTHSVSAAGGAAAVASATAGDIEGQFDPHTFSAAGGGAAVASATASDIEGQFDPHTASAAGGGAAVASATLQATSKANSIRPLSVLLAVVVLLRARLQAHLRRKWPFRLNWDCVGLYNLCAVGARRI
jgi:hypothetical protein